MPLKGPGSTGALQLTLLHGGTPDQPGPCNGTPDQPGVPPERPGSTGAAIAAIVFVKAFPNAAIVRPSFSPQ